MNKRNSAVSAVVVAAVGMAGSLCADVQTWRETGRDDTHWNTTSKNWDGGCTWTNGNAAVIPAGATPECVTEPISLTCLTNCANAERTIAATGTGRLIFVGSSPEVNLKNYSVTIAAPVESAEQLRLNGSYQVELQGSNCFPKGILLASSSVQLRVSTAKALGGGDVTQNANSMFWTTSGLDITNKIVQAGLAHGGSLVGGTSTFRRVGTTAANNGRVFGLGRLSGGASSAILTLADDSEGIGSYALRGNFGLTVDGGTIKAREDATSPFFHQWPNENYWNEHITVGRGGFVFDTNGATKELALGATLDFASVLEVVTNVVGVCTDAFVNASFEKGTTGWTWGALEGAPHGAGTVSANGEAFCNKESCYTTNGTHYAYLRLRSYLSGNFTVPDAGLWRVVFEAQRRPGYDTVAPFMVVVDEGKATEASFDFPSCAKDSPFLYHATGLLSLDSGAHTVKVKTSWDGTGDNYCTVNVDAFRLEQMEIVTNALPTFVKKGAGTAVVGDALDTDGQVIVSNGTLRCEYMTLDTPKFHIEENACLDLRDVTLAGATLSAASGATVRFSASTNNILANGSFEKPVTANYTTTAPDGWVCYVDKSMSYSGVQSNGCVMSVKSAHTPYGNQTAYVRANGGRLATTYTIADAGTYELSFVEAPRKDYNYDCKAALTVSNDTQCVLSFSPSELMTDAFVLRTVQLSLQRGTHTLTFLVSGDTRQGAMLFIDNVVLRRVGEVPTQVSGGRIDLASGTTLDLQNDTRLDIPQGVLYVDGVAIRGSRADLEQADVTVTGSGRIRIGGPFGMGLFVK